MQDYKKILLKTLGGIFACLFLIFLAISVFYTKTNVSSKKYNNSDSMVPKNNLITPSVKPKLSPGPNPFDEFDNTLTLPSPDGRYDLIIINTGNSKSMHCSYAISDIYNKFLIPIDSYLDTSKIDCVNSQMGNSLYVSNYYQWSEDDRLAIDLRDGNIKIFDPKDIQNPAIYSYNSENYIVDSTDSEFKYWILKNKTNLTYSVYKDGKIIINDISIPQSPDGHVFGRSLYDNIHNGFLFVSRKYLLVEGEDYSQAIFDFLSLDSLTVLNLLTTDPTLTPGRGCSGVQYIIPQKDTIQGFFGCVTIDAKYRNSEGILEIPFN